MNVYLQLNNKKLWILSIFLFLMFIMVLLIKKHIWDTKVYDVESRLQYIQQSKNITQKDFYPIIAQMQPKTTPQDENTKGVQSATINQEHETETTQLQTPLKLHAILNQNVLINATWLHIHESFTYNNTEYIVQKITTHGVYLQYKDNPNNIFYLEIFTTPEELLLHMY